MNTLQSKRAEIYTWLPLSVYCELNLWPLLYEECILGLLKKKIVKRCIVKLCLHNQYHVDFQLKVSFRQRRSAASSIDKVIKSFLRNQEQAVAIVDDDIENEVIFMPFPGNSVQYGLGSIEKKDKLNPLLKNCISNMNKSLLLDKDLAHEDILITLFVVYSLVVTHFRESYDYKPEAIFNDLAAEDKVVDLNVFKDLFENERELFESLSLDIDSLTILDDLPVFKPLHEILKSNRFLNKDAAMNTTSAKQVCAKLIYDISNLIQVSPFFKWSVLYAVQKSLNFADNQVFSDSLLVS